MTEQPALATGHDEHVLWKAADAAFLLIGLTACGAVAFAPGGMALLAVGIAAACLAGSVTVGAFSGESPRERDLWKCGEAPAIAVPALAVAQEPETGHSHHWRQVVSARQVIDRLAERPSGQGR